MSEFALVSDIIVNISQFDPFSINIEVPDEAKEIFRRKLESSESAVAERTDQAKALVSIVLVPLAIFVALFVLKVIYDIFTKTADSVVDGISDATDRVKAALLSKHVAETDEDDEYEDDEEQTSESREEKEAEAKEKKKRMLFGEILTKYILEHVTEEDIEKALAVQKEQTPEKRIGEILLEAGHVTNSDILRALKIQEKQGKN
ncbi:MAG: hypothetical protein OEY64_07045 [Nitrospinota bacterium]|nr:hypothetical protein [Nitrospinota bacterium]